ncbi:uncharacterized protein BDZ99DRAFT_496757 [Mytilinidion resinicola]|uniref:Uncharacterized protein n=1 Tax=Mytilinidion resinicola TaxID=574789 RepID=A0A6A6YUV4_9PEZI|nr:uncharacterized protein BDZ99DRAFT_496757 [Mytilinidion resinicola]KAF2812309.1 hypothetical protein BDZ99DRAFT_496757 [Mytilinidion resinicola]
MVSVNFLGLLLSSALVVSALNTGTTTVQKCTTKQSSKSIKEVPTSTKTTTVTLLPKIILSTTHKTVTTTAKPITTSIVSETTITDTFTDFAVTNTFSTTSTDYTTITNVAYSTLTFKTEEVTGSATAVLQHGISTVSGNRMNQVTRQEEIPRYAPGAGPPPSPSTPEKAKRAGQHPHGDLVERGAAKGGCNSKTYPVAVQLPADVSITESFSTTLTVTEGETTTIAVAATVTSQNTVSQTVTSYAACATNNILGPALSNGRVIKNIYTNTAGGFSGTSMPACHGVLRRRVQPSSGTCYIFSTLSGTCGA